MSHLYKKSVILLLIIGIALFVSSCNTASSPSAPPGEHSSTPDKTPGAVITESPAAVQPTSTEPVLRKARSDEIGRKAVCPVMKNELTVSKDTDAAEYKGKTYFFCCASCPPEFKKNPEKYVK